MLETTEIIGLIRMLTVIWASICIITTFLLLFDLKFNTKKNFIVSYAAMLPFMILAGYLIQVLGEDYVGKIVFYTLTIPSLIFFMAMTRVLDWKFFATYCFVDTFGYGVIAFTLIADRMLGGMAGIMALVIGRVILCPIIVYIIYKYFSIPYKKILTSTETGWWMFTAVSAVYYLLIVYMISNPVLIIYREDDIFTFILVIITMVLSYTGMFGMLLGQRSKLELDKFKLSAESQSEILRIELDSEKEYVAHARRVRHDMRHILLLIRNYIDSGNYQSAKDILVEFETAINNTGLKMYCENDVVNSVFRIYDRRCSQEQVTLTIEAVVPKALPYSNLETGTLFGNLLENAFEASTKCEISYIKFTSKVKGDRLYIEITNSKTGHVEFDDGLPRTTKEGGGIGIRSVTKLLAEHGGMMTMSQDEDSFTTKIIQDLN